MSELHSFAHSFHPPQLAFVTAVFLCVAPLTQSSFFDNQLKSANDS